ncbi:MAG: hypothetical protein KDE54_03510 [Caldilineaceae bacterium]|nr:hypothetical protein [Caldilineaceae bacterium]MCB0094223.1 hypothetical protein [Caldilineaceae bacterium]
MLWRAIVPLVVLTGELLLWLWRVDEDSDSCMSAIFAFITRLFLLVLSFFITLFFITPDYAFNSSEGTEKALILAASLFGYLVLRWVLLKILGIVNEARYGNDSARIVTTVILLGIAIGPAWFGWSRLYSWYMSIYPPGHLIFAGKVVNQAAGKWPNDRLVILFLEGNEIGRTVTNRDEFWGNDQGIQDGLFIIEVDNPYHLTETILNQDNESNLIWKNKRSLSGGSSFSWIDTVEEGQLYKIPVSAKNITYAIKVIDGDVGELPPQLLVEDSAILKENNSVIIKLDNNKPAKIGSTSSKDVVRDVKYDMRTEEVEHEIETMSINNCAGNAVVSQKLVKSQTFYHDYQVDIQAGVSLDIPINTWLSVIPQLQVKYGFENGETDVMSIERYMEAKPGTNETFVLTEKEIWKIGEVNILSVNEIVTIPFKVSTNKIYQIKTTSTPCD